MISRILNLTIFELVYIILFAIIISALIWVTPIIYGKLKKTELLPVVTKARIIATAIILIITVFLSSLTVYDIYTMNKDIREESYVTYEGEYRLTHISYRKDGLLKQLRVLEIGDEVLYIDKDYCAELFPDDMGDYSGKLVYGKNSKIVIEAEYEK